MLKKLTRSQILMIAVFLAAIAYFGFRVITNKDDGKLRASGTIEAVEVNVSSETSGKVKEVLIDEGQTAKTGDPLLKLDPSLLTAQRAVAAATLQTANSAAQAAQDAYAVAQAQYNLTLAGARADAAKTRTLDWAGKAPSNFEQPKWYFTQDEQIAAAETGIKAAADDVNTAQSNLDKVIADINNTKFVEAETRVANAQMAYMAALSTYSRAGSSNGNISPDELPVKIPVMAPGYRIRIRIANQLPDNQDLSNAAQDSYDAAKAELDSAQKAYDDLLTTEAADKVLKGRAVLSVALERFQSAQDQLSRLQTGENSLRVAAASATLEQAKAATQQAMDAAQQAQANLGLLDAQMAKLIIYAPMNGVVLARNVDPGEFVQPGGAAMTMADLNELTTTVYVPEDRYGEIHLGQTVDLTVDSFPGEIFTATVSYISDQAEFTPRNVQTVAGRSATVYAVKLKVNDPDGKLKLGMPADVVFVK
jgi:multidrug efflux pump subunit AcrA (membrane-fusion protein)